MPMTLTQIESEAVKLNAKERSMLIDHLTQTLPIPPELEAVWLEEANRRHESLVAGKSKARPAEDVMRDLRKAIAKRK